MSFTSTSFSQAFMQLDTTDHDSPTVTITFKGLPNQTILEYLYDQTLEFKFGLPSFVFEHPSTYHSLKQGAFKVQIREFTQVPVVLMPKHFILPITRDGWRIVAHGILDWLTATTKYTDTDEWRWGVNLFWIAYTGWNPTFPATPMESSFSFDPTVIPVAGECIRAKFMEYLDNGKVEARSLEDHDIIWNEWVKLRENWNNFGVKELEFEKRITLMGV